MDRALDRVGFGLFHALTIPAICLACMAQSLEINLLSFLQPCVGSAFNTGPEQSALLASSNFAASCISTPFFGILADSYGRRRAAMIALTIMMVATVGSAFVTTFQALCVLQIGIGIGLGGAMIPFDLLAELSPPRVRGAVLNISAWFWSLGTLFTIGMARLFLSENASADAVPCDTGDASGSGLCSWMQQPWRFFILATSFPVTVAALVLHWVVESPYWLLQHGRRHDAAEVVRYMARINRLGGANSHFDSPRSRTPSTDGLWSTNHWFGLHSPLLSPRSPVGTAGDADEDGSPPPKLEPQEEKGVREILCEPELRTQTAIHWLLWLSSGFGWTGLVFNSALRAREQQGSCHFDFVHQFLVIAMELPGTLVVQFVVDSPSGPGGLLGGRRGVQVMAYSLCGMAGLLASAPGIVGSGVSLAGEMVARAAVTAGNSAMWIAAPELYPTRARGFGASTASMFCLLGSIPSSMWVYSGLPGWLIALGIAVANLLAAFLATCLPETALVQLASVGVRNSVSCYMEDRVVKLDDPPPPPGKSRTAHSAGANPSYVKNHH